MSVGEVKISNEVISSIAGAAATKVEGVHSLAGGVVDGISQMLGKKQFSKGIVVNVDGEEKTIELNIVVKHGYKINEVAKQIQKDVKRDVEEMAGIKIDAVNVYVDRIKIEQNEEDREEGAE